MMVVVAKNIVTLQRNNLLQVAVSIEPFLACACLLVVAVLAMRALLVLSSSMLALVSRRPLCAAARPSTSNERTMVDSRFHDVSRETEPHPMVKDKI